MRERKPDFVIPMQGEREILEIYGWPLPTPKMTGALTQDNKGNLTREYPPEFMDFWDGCSDKDCLPECGGALENGAHCERLEKAFAEWSSVSDGQTL